MPEAWLRGPVEGVPAVLMPAAHSLIDALEDIEGAVRGLSTDSLWLRPGGAASIGFHIRHAGGSIERLLAYAAGEMLSPGQLEAIATEGEPGLPPADAEELLTQLREAVDTALDRFRQTPEEDVHLPRSVGRARLPSTILGLFFHIAEHTRRHAGQVVTTAKIIKGSEGDVNEMEEDR